MRPIQFGGLSRRVTHVTVPQIALLHARPRSTAHSAITSSATMNTQTSILKAIESTMKKEPATLSDSELDKVTGGSAMSMLFKTIQATHDTQKGIIANFRV
jgi:hypothetical protein